MAVDVSGSILPKIWSLTEWKRWKEWQLIEAAHEKTHKDTDNFVTVDGDP
jgi:hypothetical protein